MFNLGNPEDIAQTYLDYAYTLGPDDASLAKEVSKDLTEMQLRDMLTFRYMALKGAGNDGQSDEVLELLTDKYDEVFKALLEASDDFRQAVIKGRVQFPLGINSRPKYYALAGGTR